MPKGWTPESVAEILTMLGLEVESASPVGQGISGVVVGRVVTLDKHPDAGKLSVCHVDAGSGQVLQVVCGATNVRPDGRYPVALEGARIAGGLRIGRTLIRGIESTGMLCSAAELGLESESEGLLELPGEWPLGGDVVGLLALDDRVLEVSITPNRADCLSIRGLAREVVAGLGEGGTGAPATAVPEVTTSRFPLRVDSVADCPHLAARIIENIDPRARTPLWLRERLRRCGVRAIHPVVDVTNLVMLDIGQPMHAYDLGGLAGELIVRRGLPQESVELLDGRRIDVDEEVLVIADATGPVGLAGIMGGAASAVAPGTTSILLESAFFSPTAIRGRARRFGLHTDASQRFERGVDPQIQTEAIELATALIVAICSGTPGPILEAREPGFPPEPAGVTLRRNRLARVLGTEVPDAIVTRSLGAVGMTASAVESGWLVKAPSWRYDIECEEDLIEEVARLSGYANIPETPGAAAIELGTATELSLGTGTVRSVLAARGYREAITYSFVDSATDRALGATDEAGLMLSNPISADMSVMRRTLWPGLLQATRHNLDRQQRRVRLFEIGTRFLPEGASHREEKLLAGVVCGAQLPEQWGAGARAIDVFDVKSDLEALYSLTGASERFLFGPGTHRALHPARTARIRRLDVYLGWIGELHPRIARELELPESIILFEIRMEQLQQSALARATEISRFPSVRRDLSLLVQADFPVSSMLEEVWLVGVASLREVVVFDIYSGDQVGSGQKSVAIGLILQDTSRTLTETEVDTEIGRIGAALKRRFGATIRDQ